MDYTKGTVGRSHKKAPRGHVEHNSKGTDKNPYGAGEEAKAALIARMKAAAEARKKED